MGIEKGLYKANPSLPHQKTFMDLEDLLKGLYQQRDILGKRKRGRKKYKNN